MTRTGYVIGAAVVVAALLLMLTVIGAVPGWLGVALTACLVPAVALIVHSQRPAAPPPRVQVEYVPTPAPPPPAVQIQAAPLPTADADYRFLLSCVACWRLRPGGSTPAYAEESARRTIIARAAQLTVDEQPGNHDMARHKLDSALAVPKADHSGNIDIWAHSVVLTLPNDDLQRQHDLAVIRKDEQVWEHRRNYERNVRSYLHREVLPDTGSAVVWWLAQDPKQIRETVGLIETLAQLSAAANNRPVDPVFRSPVEGAARPEGDGAPPGGSVNGDRTEPVTRAVRQLADLMYPIDDDAHRARLADVLAKLLTDSGHGDTAARIRTEFDAPDLDLPGTDSAFGADTDSAAGTDFAPGADPAPAADSAVAADAADEALTGRHGLPEDPAEVPPNDREQHPAPSYPWPSDQ